MTSYLMLTLDTTSPDVEIIMPSYTTQQATTQVKVVANEELIINHEVYIMDSFNTRHDITLVHNGNEFEGLLSFEGYPLGIATLYARVTDTVGNQSDLVSKAIRVMKSDFLKIAIDHMPFGNVKMKSEGVE
ncbi:hypothetical protein QFZ31_006675 [Neobacillus niacini]|uniref:hypothetical protein n=1 Tax=Neobacillus driksii TaxID=3035913 RepID=UPI00278785B7|nr:hypothetical protein [Neobacillus niacini]MDQ0976623.1 hypothetical protein [Neobacillus niacini]